MTWSKKALAGRKGNPEHHPCRGCQDRLREICVPIRRSCMHAYHAYGRCKGATPAIERITPIGPLCYKRTPAITAAAINRDASIAPPHKLSQSSQLSHTTRGHRCLSLLNPPYWHCHVTPMRTPTVNTTDKAIPLRPIPHVGTAERPHPRHVSPTGLMITLTAQSQVNKPFLPALNPQPSLHNPYRISLFPACCHYYQCHLLFL